MTIEEYIDSPLLYEVKEDFKADRWPKGCERCRIEEENDIKSKRILDLERWHDHYDRYDDGKGFITASIAFGNTCNLACVTCGPDASSKWYTEYLKFNQKEIKPNHFYKDGFVENFIKSAPEIIHFDIPGGEPLLSGVQQQKQLLKEYISKGIAKDITLHYTTNGTVFPDNDWFNIWKEYKHVEIQLSIDAINARFEYIRYPGVWNDVVKNIRSYQSRANDKLCLAVAVTVSAYNIAYLEELTDKTHELGIGMPWFGRLHYPKYMRPTVWRSDAKKYIISKLTQSKYDFSSWIKLLDTEDDQSSFEDFRYHLLRQDRYRKKNFGQTFPEMLQYLRN